MVVSDSDEDDLSVIRTLLATTPSPTNTPLLSKTSPKTPGSKSRRKRITPTSSPEYLPKKAAHELFGDYMSIEEIAAQTEKAYKEGRINHSVRSIKSVSPKVSPRSLSKKKVEEEDTASNPSLKASVKKGTFLALFVVTIVLPFLLCESLVFVLVLQHRQHDVQDNVSEQISGSVRAASQTVLDDPVVHAEVLSEGENEVIYKDSTEERLIDDTPEYKNTKTKDIEEIRKDNESVNDEVKLREAFSLIAAARSSSTSNTEDFVKNVFTAETLCSKISSLASKHALTGTNESANDADVSFLKSMLCIGGAKMTLIDQNFDAMLQEAKLVFEHLSTIYPHNIEAQAGFGTSILAQGIVYNTSVETVMDNQTDEQVALLTQATFHLKLASSLCSSQYKKIDEDTDESTTVTHAAILHNLALAYIAIGDFNSSLHLLLQATAIHRQVDSSKQALLWNLPNQVLQVVEEKALLLGAKTAGKNGRKKKRIPFVPEILSVEDMVEGL